jgi:hypothetical protein
MAINGTIVAAQGKLYIEHVDTSWSAPELIRRRWLVYTEVVDGWVGAPARMDGRMVAIYWAGSSGVVQVDIGIQVECTLVVEPIAAPKGTRGKPVRWNEGRWEKLMARGWVAV